jgi:hypothetical protein
LAKERSPAAADGEEVAEEQFGSVGVNTEQGLGPRVVMVYLTL